MNLLISSIPLPNNPFINLIMMEAILEDAPRIVLPDASERAGASSAHSRINIPLNLENWKHLEPELAQDLMWFHQHALDQKLGFESASECLNYDASTIFRVLKGTYTGSWGNVRASIRSYRKLFEQRGAIQKNQFVENGISRKIGAALNYAMANNSITLIDGESRMGKSEAARFWRDQNNHGRSVLTICPAFGGTKGLLRELAGNLGINKNLPALQMHESILRAFNEHRILIMDEAHRLLPTDRRSNPTNLEILRDIHDRTGAALALIATHRFNDQLKQMEYQFEQLLGRIGMPIRLQKAIPWADIGPIVRQYIARPTPALAEESVRIANEQGRLGVLVETLKVASQMAAKGKVPLEELHVFKAIALRQEMISGSPSKEQAKKTV